MKIFYILPIYVGIEKSQKSDLISLFFVLNYFVKMNKWLKAFELKMHLCNFYELKNKANVIKVRKSSSLFHKKIPYLHIMSKHCGRKEGYIHFIARICEG